MKQMVQIADWLKRIISLIIVAGFLELLLPNNSLKGVTRLVLGLIVIMFLMQPLTQLFNIPIDLITVATLSAPEIEVTPTPVTDRLITEGEKLRGRWESVFVAKNFQGLETKIKKIITLIDEVELEQLKLEQKNGQLERMVITVKSKNEQQLTPAFQAKIRQEICKMIAVVSDLNITPEQIEVNWNE